MANSIGFKGLQAGGPGVRKVSWGEVSAPDAGGSVWDEDQTAGTIVDINVIRGAHRLAPEGIYFSLSLSGFETNTLPAGRYDPSYHDKYVFWDYDDAYDFNAPAQVRALDVADGGNRAKARYSRGPMGSHVFRKPGTYTIRVAVLEPASGKIGFGRAKIIVGDPDRFYSGRATLFVDVTQSFTNAPRNAQLFRNIDDALNVVGNATTPHRVVLERAQVHTISSTFTYRPPPGSAATSLRIEAKAGTGAKPIIKAGDGIPDGGDLIFDNSLRRISRSVGSEIVIQGIKFQGPWNPKTLSGRSIDCFEFNGVHGSRNVLIDACDFSNWGRTFLTRDVGGSIPERTMFFNDVSISGWTTCGFFGGSDSVLSFTGCGFVQDIEAITRQTPGSNSTLSPIRIASARMCNFWACDLFSSTGWSRYGSISAVQPGIRWNTSPAVAGAMLNMQACVVESGRLALSLKPQSANQPRIVANGIVEGNIAISGFQGDAVAHSAFGGMTFRNNIFVLASQKNSAEIGGQDQTIRGFVYFNGGASANPVNEASPVTIYNNTFVNLTPVNAPPVADRIGMKNVVQRNDLMHQPALGDPHKGLVAVRAFGPRYKGYRANASTVHTKFENPAESGSLWVPDLNSPALGNALEEPSSVLDFQGDRRPEPPSQGALEAD
ncbi:MAG: hypothetical protein V2I76_00970 [Roseobacter sp.]|jgi:hypothetical protein|nr:hypothetical protein [Roseobacter sp.]